MKSMFMFVCIFFLSTAGMAQNMPPVNSNTDGFYLGVNLLGAGWNVSDSNSDAESGAGLGLKAGYNFSHNFGVFLGFDGTSINPDTGENYGLGHFDIGVEGIFSNPTENIRPFVRASYLGMAAVYDDPSGDIEVSGAGFGLGGGIYFFPRTNFSLELSYNRSWVNLNSAKVGSQSSEIDQDATSGRFAIGAAFHF